MLKLVNYGSTNNNVEVVGRREQTIRFELEPTMGMLEGVLKVVYI